MRVNAEQRVYKHLITRVKLIATALFRFRFSESVQIFNIYEHKNKNTFIYYLNSVSAPAIKTLIATNKAYIYHSIKIFGY